MSNIKTIDIHQKIQEKNDTVAEIIRKRRLELNIPMVDIVGTVGAGKTSILEYFSRHYQHPKRLLVINGDLATSIDAERIGKYGSTCLQINTGRGCHLNAHQIEQALSEVILTEFDFIFVENVGNLICPATTDVGADYKIAVTSITEGPYVFEKHPITFKTSNLAVMNKIDLADAMEIDADEVIDKAKGIYPNVNFIKISVKTGEGMEELARKIGLTKI
ncbi:MAG: hydrogenase nickel incorporation protein HypB [Candidatus Kariarchaeaceae archaeon]